MSTQEADRTIDESCTSAEDVDASRSELTDAGTKRSPFYLPVRDQRQLQQVADSPETVRQIVAAVARAHRALRCQMILTFGFVAVFVAFAASTSVVTVQLVGWIIVVMFVAVTVIGFVLWVRQEQQQGWEIRTVAVLLKTIRVLDDPDTSFVRRTRAIDAAAATFYRAFRIDRRSRLRLAGRRAPRTYRVDQRASAQRCAVAIASQGRRILQDPPHPRAAADALRRAVLDTSYTRWRRVEEIGICDEDPPLWQPPGFLARAATIASDERLWRPFVGVGAVLTIVTLTANLLR